MDISQLFADHSIALPAPIADKTPSLSESVLLTELDWYDKSPLTDVFKKNRGRFVHFSRVPKLGVNPNKSHKDPHGIYFYPVDWALSGSERVRDGQQWGFEWPYYFLVDIDMSGPGWILSKVTWDDVEALARRNGWIGLLDEFREKSPEEQKKILPYYATQAPASIAWHFLDRLNQAGTLTWNKAFAGLSFIYDDNQSIINNLEPCQVVVLDPRVIRNSSMHDNRGAVPSTASDPKLVYGHAVKTFINRMHAVYGGEVRWQEVSALRPHDPKRPGAKMRAPAWTTLSFTIGEKQFRLEASARREEVNLYLRYTFRREQGSIQIAGWKELRSRSIDELLDDATQKIEEIAAMQSDLRFEPVLSEKQCRQMVEQIVSPDAQFRFETEIDNGSYPHLRCSAEYDIKVEDYTFTVLVSVFSTREYVRPSIDIKSRDSDAQFWISVSPNKQYTKETIGEIGPDLLNGFVDKIAEKNKQFGPDGWQNPKLNEPFMAAWIGWFVTHCGISFGGRLAQAFPDQVRAWEQDDDHNYLLYRFANVMGRRW